MTHSLRRLFVTTAALGTLSACGGGDGGTGPGTEPTPGTLDFEVDVINLFTTRSTSVTLVNGTDQQLGPIGFAVTSTFDASEIDVRGVRGNALPPNVPALRPGGEASVSINLNDTGLPPGIYESLLEARIDGVSRATMRLRFEVTPGSPSSAVSVAITDGPVAPRQGDPVQYVAEARDSFDEVLPPNFIEWFVLPTTAGHLDQNGRFTPYQTGAARIIVRSGVNFDTLAINVAARNATGSLQVVGRGQNGGAHDVSVSGGYAYVGTAAGTVETWDVSDPANPALVHTLELDASSVPSVHVRADGALGAAAHLGSGDGQNGVTLFDLTDPAAPTVVSRFTNDLTMGVSSVFLDGDHLYAAQNAGGVRIVDLTDAANPALVSGYSSTSSYVQEVSVIDGVMYVAHFNSGLHLVDVGNGAAGGSPADPNLIGSSLPAGGQTASAALAGDLIFTVEADDLTPGVLHVMDATDPGAVVEIASWAVDDLAPTSSAAADGDRLVGTWGAGGVRLLDVSGELSGDLERQERELSVQLYDGESTDAVRVRVVGDLAFVADAAGGLVILRIS